MAVATKTCTKCGWVYPITHPDKRCRFCGTIFKKRFCVDCGLYTDIRLNDAICNKCQAQRNKKYYETDVNTVRYNQYFAKIRQNCVKQFEDWLKLIAAVPKPYTFLTEDDWIAACRYFGSCALCDSDSIDARSFFIPFSLGGRYAAWNVMPVCDKCATMLVTKQNPFLRYHKQLTTNSRDLTRVIAYLQPILERAGKK